MSCFYLVKLPLLLHSKEPIAANRTSVLFVNPKPPFVVTDANPVVAQRTALCEKSFFYPK
ncbi:MAG: hypothetical protein H6Q17_1055 [Bacteroidetes bacterium]|nr:hypothetical protein [Bacteroidota bacterium]